MKQSAHKRGGFFLSVKQTVFRQASLFTALLFALTPVTAAVSPGQAAAFTGGDGSVGSPFRIADCSDLQNINSDLDAHYILTTGINCDGTAFTPIGPSFTGVLDGQNHTIDTLDISGSDAGLFQSTTGATIQNLMINSGTINASGNTGSFVGNAYNTTLNNVHSSMTINGQSTVGGLVGLTDDGLIIKSSSFTGEMSAHTYSGGLVGLMYENPQNVINNSYFNGVFNIIRRTEPSDEAGFSNGGLVGLLYGGTINNSYSAGSITYTNGAGYTGGLAGLTYGGLFNNVFSASTISGTSGTYTGAGFGAFYSTGGDTSAGTNVHYDSHLANFNCAGFTQGNMDCSAQNAGNTAPSYFKGNSTRPVFSAWDFSTIWTTRLNGYPSLRSNTDTSDLNGDSILDIDQPNIGGYVSSITGKTVAIDVGAGCELTTDDMTTEAQLAVQDPAYDYVDGLWDFEADCGEPGASTTIKLYYYDIAVEGLVARKHNPNINAFFNIPGAMFSQQTIDGHAVVVVTYQIEDGGTLDTDGLVDGMINDPAGVARLVLSVPNTGIGGRIR